jgi:RNA polymerase sigma-70 factor (ECF subfamily)
VVSVVSRELLAAVRRGDPKAFEEVVRTTHRQVYTQALRLVGDPQEAEDVTQDAYLRVFRGLSGFRGDAKFETWLYRIVANAAINHLRKRGRFGELLWELPEESPKEPASPQRLDEQTVDRDELLRALDGLPLGMKTVVVLKDVYDLSCAEIGEELGISEGAVKVRLHRARRRLQEVLFDRSDPDDDR